MQSFEVVRITDDVSTSLIAILYKQTLGQCFQPNYQPHEIKAASEKNSICFTGKKFWDKQNKVTSQNSDG